MELAIQEQVRERQEMEKKMQKLIKTMDHFERAKREEAAPLIEASFQRCLALWLKRNSAMNTNNSLRLN
ncbi:hypothetical protein Lser_V15G44180 [Lactuca serriola]